MNGQDLPSDSDASDDDYCPSGEDSAPPSEEESGSEPDEIETNEDGDRANKKQSTKQKKSRKPVKRKSLKRKLEDDRIEEKEESTEQKKLSEEEEKKKADDIWADFLKDSDEPVRKRTSLDSSSNSSDTSKNTKSSNKLCPIPDETKPKVEEKENKQIETQLFEFAGETIKVEREVATGSSIPGNVKSGIRAKEDVKVARGRGGGGSGALSAFLGQIGKKSKLSTLEKSKMDWNNFKKSEGIEEDVQHFNKGKDGYLERQDFLQRTDLRRFEIEKSLRQKRSGR